MSFPLPTHHSTQAFRCGPCDKSRRAPSALPLLTTQALPIRGFSIARASTLSPMAILKRAPLTTTQTPPTNHIYDKVATVNTTTADVANRGITCVTNLITANAPQPTIARSQTALFKRLCTYVRVSWVVMGHAATAGWRRLKPRVPTCMFLDMYTGGGEKLRRG